MARRLGAVGGGRRGRPCPSPSRFRKNTPSHVQRDAAPVVSRAGSNDAIVGVTGGRKLPNGDPSRYHDIVRADPLLITARPDHSGS
jgi:hypothetical protein